MLVITKTAKEKHVEALMQTDQYSMIRNTSSEDLLMNSSSKRNSGTFYSVIKGIHTHLIF